MKVKITGFILSTIILVGILFLFNYDKPVIKTLEVTQEQKINNLKAFSKIYGYVRYFHPSDEASELEWDRFAIYGVQEVKGARDNEELKKRLEELFLPIAPTLSLYLEVEAPKKSNSIKQKDGMLIAWQYLGLNPDNDVNSVYKSKRVQATIENGKYKLGEEKIFQDYPKIDEPINKEIVPGIFCNIPVVLYVDENKTIGTTEETAKKFEALNKNILSVSNYATDNENVRFAGIIMTWNILNHFYPYFHVTDSNWENQLEVYLKKTEEDKSRDEYISTLAQLLEKTKDGHAIYTFNHFHIKKKMLPFIVDIIENEVVVTVAEDDSPVQEGDIITHKEGIPAIELIEQLKEEIPGSPQVKNYFASKYFRYEDSAEIQFKRGEEIFIQTIKGKQVSNLDEFNRKESFKEIEDNIYYLDLRMVSKQTLQENIDTLSKAKGVIFDLRGYPGSSEVMMDVLGHLTEKPVKGPIVRTAQTIYPDREELTFKEIRNPQQSKAPLLKGQSVFLTYGGAMSQPEYWLGYIKDNKLAEIVGQPTAGSDGDIQQYRIPGNITGYFTGAEVLNADRSQTHLIGITPTIHVERTIEAIKKGEDEYIQAALELINK